MCVRARTCVHAALRKQREALKDLWRRRDKLKDTETAEMGSPWRQWTVFLKGLSLLHCCCCFFFFLFGDWRLSPYSTYGEGGEVRRCRTWSTGLWVRVWVFLSPLFFNVIFCLGPTFCLLWGWYVWKCVWGYACAAAVTNYDCFSHMQHSLDAIRSANCESCHPLWVILIQKGQLRVVIWQTV